MSGSARQPQALPEWWARLIAKRGKAFRGLRVGVYGSGGAPYHHAALLALWGCAPRPVRAEEIRAGALDALDVLIVPGGGFTAMSGMLSPLGVAGAGAVREWVGAGGMYLSSCAGSVLPAELGEAYWRAHEEARQLHMVRAPLANGSDSVFEGLTSPGVGTIRVRVAESEHWLARDLPEQFELVHYNGPLFDLAGLPRPNAERGLRQPEGVVAVQAAGDAFTPSEAFMSEVAEGTLLERCAARGAFAGITAPYGSGQVVLFGSHPEFGFDVLQLGWGPGATLIANALAHQAARRGVTRKGEVRPDDPADAAEASVEVLDEVTARLERIAGLFRELAAEGPQPWLEPGRSPSFMGLAPAALWREAAQRAARAADEAATLVRRLEGEDLRPAARWLDEPPFANQDVGFMGLCQLAERAEDALLAARRQMASPPPLTHAYDGLQTHPFHLAVGSYLSAAGLSAAALLSAVTVAALVGRSDTVPLSSLLAA